MIEKIWLRIKRFDQNSHILNLHGQNEYFENIMIKTDKVKSK